MSIKMAKHNKLLYTSVLAADVGATKTTLGICNWNGQLDFKKINTYKTKNFPDLVTMIKSFVSNTEMPQKLCLGVAGPVRNGNVTMTNTGFQINSIDISNQFNKIPVTLINDLEATAYGLAALHENDVQVLVEADSNLHGNIAVIAPGTGLGEAGILQEDDGYHPFATEGGHCLFAPVTNLDIELFQFLHKKYDHVSWERIVSGPGICNIYDFFKDVVDMEEPAWLKEKFLVHDKATVIGEYANDSEICSETIKNFIRFLALESNNLALKMKATGGVYIGGGIIPHLIPVIHKDFFTKWFLYAGRMKDLVKNIPVKVIMNKNAPLTGAAFHGMYSN